MAFPLTHHTMMSLQNEEPSPTPFSDWEDMSFDDMSVLTTQTDCKYKAVNLKT